MKVKLLRNAFIRNRRFKAGAVIEIEEEKFSKIYMEKVSGGKEEAKPAPKAKPKNDKSKGDDVI